MTPAVRNKLSWVGARHAVLTQEIYCQLTVLHWRPGGQLPCSVPQGGFPKGTQAVAPRTPARSVLSSRAKRGDLPTIP